MFLSLLQLNLPGSVTGGIYQVCRNPMYLGNILLIIGFAIFSNSLVFLAVFVPLFLIFYYAIIKAEENFLHNKFGSQFDEYKKSSNALIPKLSGDKTAFNGNSFNFKKVINKEHNAIFLYFTGILLLLGFKNFINLGVLLTVFSLLLMAYLVVKVLKIRKKLI